MLWLWVTLVVGLAAAQYTTRATGSTSSTPTGAAQAAKDIITNMNIQADPCEDFYEYACGNFPKANPIPADAVSMDYFEILEQRVRKVLKEVFQTDSSSQAINMAMYLYNGCMDVNKTNMVGPKVFDQEICSIGSWPVLDGNLKSKENGQWKNFDLTQTLLKTYSYRAVDILFQAAPSVDPKNSTRRIITIDQAVLGMGTRELYLDTEQFGAQIEAYKQLFVDYITLFAKDTNRTVNTTALEQAAEDVIIFETRLANATSPNDHRTNMSALYHIEKLDNLQTRFPMINWKTYFTHLTPVSVHPYLNSNPDVLLYEPKFLEQLQDIIVSTPQGVIANYILFQYFGSLRLQLGTKYEEAEQKFRLVMLGQKDQTPRDKECISNANDLLPYAMGSAYVKKAFDHDSKDAAMALFTEIKEVFQGILTSQDWMEQATKAFALQKLEKLNALIGYPDFIVDDKQLDAFYKKLTIKPSDPYIYSFGKVTGFKIDYHAQQLIEPVDRNEFDISAAVINAFYQPTANIIAVPAGILQSPFFNKDTPKALNYGGIGVIVGHEITHGFDTSGSEFDGDGNLKNWWDNKTAEEFQTRAKCIIDEYRNVKVPGTNMSINGELTKTENIADNGGVKESFTAYSNWLKKNGQDTRLPGLEHFSDQQMFFIGYGQVWCGDMTDLLKVQLLLIDSHSPMKYRINIPLSNSPDFAKAFNCSAGSLMNPDKKCSVW